MDNNRILMTQEEQKEVMLYILTEFANFCEEHNLNYFLDAGTLLGAVRHKGYIPWDDDVDVCMPIEDYDKFIQLTKKKEGVMSKSLVVEYPENTIYPFLKISDNRTILIEFPDKYPMEVSVYIDVFPKVGIFGEGFNSRIACGLSSFLRYVQWFNKFSIYAWKENGNTIQKLIAAVGRFCIRKPNKPIQLQNRFIHWYHKKYPLEVCKYVTTLTNGEFHKIAPKECFANYIMMDFEGIKFRGPIGYDTYLKCLYPGDYMELPPKDKRIHHDVMIYWKPDVQKQIS